MIKNFLLENIYFLNIKIFNNIVFDYLLFILIFLVLLLTIYILKRGFVKIVDNISKKTLNDFDDFLIKNIKSTSSLFFVVVSFFTSLKILILNNTIEDVVNKIFLIFLIYYFIRFLKVSLIYILKKVLKNNGKDNNDNDTTFNLFSLIGNILIYITGILLVITSLGFKVTPILTSLGIGGIAIGFALQNILKDVFGSFSILMERPFRIGDFVKIADKMGTVQQIGLKNTKVKSISGEELTIPNGNVTTNNIHNYGKMEKRRISFILGIEYGTNVIKLKKIKEMIKEYFNGKSSLISLDRINLKEFGPHSLNYEVVYFLNSGDYLVYANENEKFLFYILEKLEKEKINIAFPTQKIILEKN